MSSLYRLEFLKSASVNVANGSDTITVTGNVDCSTVYQGTAIFINDFQVVEAVSGTGINPATGESSITLRSAWNRPSVTAGTLVGFNSIEGLNSAVTRLNEVIKSVPDFTNVTGEGLLYKDNAGAYTLKALTAYAETILAATNSSDARNILGIISATSTAEGLVRLSTQAEALALVNDTTSMTPLKTSQQVNQKIAQENVYTLSPNSIFKKQNSDLEGGEIRMELADNATIDGPVVIDVISNNIRIREGSGTARGAFLNIEACAAGSSSVMYHSGIKLQASELESYTIGTLPSAAANNRRAIYVSDLSGGAAPCFSNGTNWLRYSDNTIAS